MATDKTNCGYDQPNEPVVYRGPEQSYPGQGYHSNYPQNVPAQSPGYGPQPVMSQPASHSAVVVSTGCSKPVAAPQNIRSWSTGLFGCFEDIASCCFALWCFPCFMCTLSERLGEHFCGPFCCGFPFNTVLRNKVRTMYGITGTVCSDVCTVACCGVCAMCQLKRELDAMDTVQNSYNMVPNTVVVTQGQSQY